MPHGAAEPRQAVRFPGPRADPHLPPPQYVPDDVRCPQRVELEYGGQAWLVTGFAQARQVLADTGFSSDSTDPRYPDFPVAPRQPVPGHFLSMDAPEHVRLRRAVVAGFGVPALKPMRPLMAAYAAELVESVIKPDTPFDLLSGIATPLHGQVMARLFGVPARDHLLFTRCAEGLFRHDASPASRAVATARLKQYLHRLLAAPATSAPQSLVGRLAASVHGGELTADEAVGIANLIVMAGQETTTSLFGLAMLSLMSDSAQWRLVCADPGRWAGPAVREALRYWTVVHHGVARVATSDTEVSGVRMSAGDPVVVHLPSANRDPTAFSSPDVFSVARDPRNHLAFGHGPHRCLGGSLAEFEVSVAVETLARRRPALQLAMREGDLHFLHDRLVFGVRELVLVDPSSTPAVPLVPPDGEAFERVSR